MNRPVAVMALSWWATGLLLACVGYHAGGWGMGAFMWCGYLSGAMAMHRYFAWTAEEER